MVQFTLIGVNDLPIIKHYEYFIFIIIFSLFTEFDIVEYSCLPSGVSVFILFKNIFGYSLRHVGP